jgi:PAS domain S-box-containing protein
VLAVSLAVAVVAWNDSRHMAEQHLRTEFNALIGETRTKLDDRIAGYTQVLRTGAALFAASGPGVSRDAWHRFIAAQDLARNYPAIPAVAFARRIDGTRLDEFVAEMKASGVEDFAVRPPGRRDSYVVNTYSEPFVGGNVKALGYDMWQDTDRRRTMERAAETGQPRITQRVTLRVDEQTNPVPAFIMYLPVRHDGDIFGYVLSPFRMPTLMQDLLGRNDEHLTLAIYDGTEAVADALFYRSEAIDADPRLTTWQTLEIGGRQWTLEFASRPGLERKTETDRPRSVLAIGLAFSLLLFGITWSLGRTKARAQAMAWEKTRSLRENQALLQAIVDNSSAVIYVKDPAGRHLLVNTLYESVFQPKAEILGKTNSEIFPPEIALALTKNDRIVLDGGSAITVEEMVPHPDGPHTYLSVKFPIPGEDGKPLALCGISTDITGHKAAADHMVEINRQLESQAQHLRRSNAELEQFAYVASHDLQEPLRMISSYAQLIARRYGASLDEDAREFIGFMVDGTTRMQTMILDLLEYSRIGRKEDAPAELEADDCVAAARHNLAAAIETAGATIECGPLPRIKARPHQMVALLQNLIGNAVKYRDPARPPVVRISGRRVGDAWEFTVADNGIGIHPDYFERIFMIFQRLHTHDKYEGSGIGLAICKKIVEHHDGRLWLESVPGEGSTFRFTLPAP